jgi:hypothetical protein
LDLPSLAAATREGTSSLSPGPKMLLGRIQHVRSPYLPLALITNFSASAFVSEYESLNWSKRTYSQELYISMNQWQIKKDVIQMRHTLSGYGIDSSALKIP